MCTLSILLKYMIFFSCIYSLSYNFLVATNKTDTSRGYTWGLLFLTEYISISDFFMSLFYLCFQTVFILFYLNIKYCACCHSLREFICAFRGPYFLGVFHPLWLLRSFHLLFLSVPWALRARNQ